MTNEESMKLRDPMQGSLKVNDVPALLAINEKLSQNFNRFYRERCRIEMLLKGTTQLEGCLPFVAKIVEMAGL